METEQYITFEEESTILQLKTCLHLQAGNAVRGVHTPLRQLRVISSCDP